MTDVLHRLEPLHERDQIRWHDLLWFLLSWSMRRRASDERAPLVAAVAASHENVTLRREIETMSQMVGRAWEDEVLERGIDRGKLLGALANCRENLRVVLEERLGPLPITLFQRIEQTEDIDRLKAGVRQAVRITKLDELTL